MHGGDEVVEGVPLGVNVLHRTERRFGKLRDGVAEVANLLAVRLEFKVTLRNELFDLCHDFGESLANVCDIIVFHQLAQSKLGEMSLDLELESIRVILIQHLLLDPWVGV